MNRTQEARYPGEGAGHEVVVEQLRRPKGKCTISVIDEATGEVKSVHVKDNLVVNAGLDWLKEFAFDAVTPTAIARMGWIEIGSGATPAAVTDTALVAALARRAFDTYTAGGTGILTVDVTIPAGTGTGTVTEAGIFNAAAAGTMFNRVVFTGIAKGAGDALKVSFTITFS